MPPAFLLCVAALLLAAVGLSMRKSRLLIPAAAWLAMGLVFTTSSASAARMNCSRWLRLNAGQKEATVHGMIDDALRSNRARQFSVNREAIGRCLRDNVFEIAIAFDDVCSDSRSADMQAIHRVFKNYVWSCAG